jgi:hypothetical protein
VGSWAPPHAAGPLPPGYGAPPAARPGVIPLRPLGLGEIFDGSIATIRRYWKVQLGTTAAVVLVLTIIQAPMMHFLGQSLDLSPDSPGKSPAVSGRALTAAMTSQLFVGSVSVLAQLVLQGALMIVVGRAVLGQEIDSRTAWQLTRPRMWRLIGLAVSIGCMCGAPIMLPIVVGGALAAAGAPVAALGVVLVLGVLVAGPVCVWLWVLFGVSAPALVLEQSTIRAALRRSRRLVAGSWWRVFGILLLNVIASTVLSGVLALPFGLIGLALGGKGLFTVALIGTALAKVVVYPFTAGVVALLYVDLRMRREGLDLSLTRAAVASATAGR